MKQQKRNTIWRNNTNLVRKERNYIVWIQNPQRLVSVLLDGPRANFGFVKVERLPGNVGYIKFDEFNPSDEAKQVAAAAMNFVANTDALIFDLRENGGGSPVMIAFLSGYLFDKSVHLNSFYYRPTDSHSETWSDVGVPGATIIHVTP